MSMATAHLHSQQFIDRLEKLRKLTETAVGEMCEMAGLSRNVISASKSRTGGLGWDVVAPLVLALSRWGVRREWLLWGEGQPMTLPGRAIRFGRGAEAEPEPAPITATAKRRRQPKGGTHALPRPGHDSGGPKQAARR